MLFVEMMKELSAVVVIGAARTWMFRILGPHAEIEPCQPLLGLLDSYL